MQYAWLIWSLGFLAVWFLIYLFQPTFRKEMLYMGLGTMLFGFTEPLFVPGYWVPPTLFDLARKTGFDIESLIFTFSIGGIGSVIYKIIFGKSTIPVESHEKMHRRHRFHVYILLIPVPVFLALAIFSGLNHIYCGIIAMFLGAIAALYCRPDLKFKIWAGGLLFLVFYFAFFGILVLVYPDYVHHVWNLKALTGVLVLGIPIEELLFAFTFGLYWSSLFEHISWQKLIARL